MAEIVRKRIGKDLRFTMEVLTNGEPLPLEGRDLTLVITNPSSGFILEKTEFSVSGNKMAFDFYGIEQKSLGRHIATVWENYKKIGETVVDVDNIVFLVRYSWEE